MRYIKKFIINENLKENIDVLEDIKDIFEDISDICTNIDFHFIEPLNNSEFITHDLSNNNRLIRSVLPKVETWQVIGESTDLDKLLDLLDSAILRCLNSNGLSIRNISYIEIKCEKESYKIRYQKSFNNSYKNLDKNLNNDKVEVSFYLFFEKSKH